MNRYLAIAVLISAFVGCNSPAQNNSENAETTKAAANYETVPKNQIAKIDAHKFKEECITERPVKHFDIVWDKSEPTKDKRHVQLIKKGSSPPKYIDCHMTWGEVLKQFPKK